MTWANVLAALEAAAVLLLVLGGGMLLLAALVDAFLGDE